MSDKPTQLPEWATNDTATEVTEPSSADKLTGWVPDEQPGAQHMNWILHRIYLWTQWISEGILQRSTLTNHAPILQTCDRDARPRHYLGPEGYWMGNTIQETNRWQAIDTANLTTGDDVSPHMVVLVGSNVTAKVVPGSSGNVVTADPQVELTVTDAGGTGTTMVYCRPGGTFSTIADKCPISDLDNTVAVMEWRASFDTTPESGADFGGGFNELTSTTAPADGTLNSLAAIISDGSISGNFRYVVGNNTAETTGDLGITIALDTMYTFRIEHHGANTPVGVDNTTSAVTRFFIDGVMEHEETGANVMDAGNVTPMFWGSENGSPASVHTMSVCTVKYAWNSSLDWDVPA